MDWPRLAAHPGLRCALAVEHIERVLEVGEEILANAVTRRIEKLAVVRIVGIWNHQVRLARNNREPNCAEHVAVNGAEEGPTLAWRCELPGNQVYAVFLTQGHCNRRGDWVHWRRCGRNSPRFYGIRRALRERWRQGYRL